MGMGKSKEPVKAEPVVTDNNNNRPDDPQMRGVPRSESQSQSAPGRPLLSQSATSARPKTGMMY